MLFLRLLGGLSVERDGAATNAAGGQRTRLALLAVIAASGRMGVGRDRLLALFWPESDERRARGALKQALFALRRGLNEPALIDGTNDLRLNPDVVGCDVWEFDRAISEKDFRRAAVCYTGPFLDGVFARGSPELDQWIERERTRLSDAYHAALQNLARSAATVGDHTAAIEAWGNLARENPTSGRIAREYMEALVANGDRESAIRHGMAYAERVHRELNAAPDAEVTRLVGDLRGAVREISNASTQSSPDGGRLNPSALDATIGVAAINDRAKPTNRRWWFAGGTVLAGAALVAVIASAVRPGYEPNSVVIAPFDNETASPEFYPLTRIIADWLTSGLDHTHLLDVVDFRTVDSYTRDSTGSPRPSLAVAQHAGAGTLVRGTIYRRGDSLRVESRVIRVSDGSVLADLEPVMAPLSDPQRLLEPLRQELLGAFAVLSDSRLKRWARTPSTPPTYAAYQDYVSGLDALTRQRADSAGAHLMHAAVNDDGFAAATMLLLEISDLPVVRRVPGTVPFIDSLERAAVARRDSMTPYDQAALDAAIAYRHSDWAGRLSATRRMVEIAPRSSAARFSYAHALIAGNFFAEAISQLHQIDLGRSWLGQMEYFWVWENMAHHQNGDFTGALREAERAWHRYPENSAFCLFRADHEAAMGKERAATDIVNECLRVAGQSLDTAAVFLTVGNEFSAHGHEDAARRYWERALAAKRVRNPNAPAPFIRINLGQWEEAYAALPADTSELHSLGARGVIAAHAGDFAEASRVEKSLEARAQRQQDGRAEIWLASLALARGNRDSAVALLRRSVAAGNPPAFNFHAVWYLRGLEAYPAFRKLVGPKSPGG